MYITNYNLRRLLNSINHSENDPKINIEYEMINDILSTKDLERLSSIKAFFLGRSVNITELKPLHIRDTKTYIHEGNKPSFHKSKECERANKNFFDYLIPHEVKLRGDEEINRYRERAKGIDFKNDAECIALAAEFDVRVEVIRNSSSEDNGGVESFILYDIKELEALSIEKLDQKLFDLSKLINEFSEKDGEYRDIYNLRYRDPYSIRRLMSGRGSLSTIAHELSQYKASAIAIIEQKSRKQSPFDQEKIEEKLLLELNFVPCRTCLTHNLKHIST